MIAAAVQVLFLIALSFPASDARPPPIGRKQSCQQSRHRLLPHPSNRLHALVALRFFESDRSRPAVRALVPRGTDSGVGVFSSARTKQPTPDFLESLFEAVAGLLQRLDHLVELIAHFRHLQGVLAVGGAAS